MARLQKPVSFSMMKKINSSLILHTIREKELISRANVAKLTGLTPATVTNITSELIERKLITEAELGESSGGRKPVMLRINADYYNIIGVYIGSKHVEVILTNLNAEIEYISEFKLDKFPSSQVVLDRIIREISGLLKTRSKKVLGIGVGLHGVVKSYEGVLIFAPNLGWENIHIKSLLEGVFDIPVYVENDVRAMALGESWFGLAKNIENYIYIYVGYGIGGCIMSDDTPYRGVTDGAGEFGHTTIEVNGPKCSCGNNGCLQALASHEALVTAYTEMSGISPNKDIDVDEIIFNAEKGDLHAIQCMRNTGRYLGIGVANLINTFNPPLIVINGRISHSGNLIMDEILNEVSKRSITHMAAATRIVFSKLSSKAVLMGTVTLVLEHVYNPEFKM